MDRLPRQAALAGGALVFAAVLGLLWRIYTPADLAAAFGNAVSWHWFVEGTIRLVLWGLLLVVWLGVAAGVGFVGFRILSAPIRIPFALIVAGTLAAVLVTTQAEPPASEPTEGDDFEALAHGLFTEHVVALEVLGILLTAALIGAMVIARPLGTELDTTNYPNKRKRSELEDIQNVSDVDRNLGGSK